MYYVPYNINIIWLLYCYFFDITRILYAYNDWYNMLITCLLYTVRLLHVPWHVVNMEFYSWDTSFGLVNPCLRYLCWQVVFCVNLGTSVLKRFLQLGWRLMGVRSTHTECSLNVPWMFPECSLNVPWTFPERVCIDDWCLKATYYQNVPWMFPECSLNVPWARMYWWLVSEGYILSKCSLNVPWMFLERSLSAYVLMIGVASLSITAQWKDDAPVINWWFVPQVYNYVWL
jgi:hypothetical protein